MRAKALWCTLMTTTTRSSLQVNSIADNDSSSLNTFLEPLMLQTKSQRETQDALQEGWEHIEKMELAIANEMGFDTVEQLDELMEELNVQTLDELADVLDLLRDDEDDL